MFPSCRPLGSLIVALLPWTCLAGVAEAEVTIRLSGVPELLSLPLPAGQNQLLTAHVDGGPVRDVWLAPSEQSSIRVILTRVKDGEYQINLGQDEVMNALRGSKEGSQFQVFAETEDGQRIASVPVRYALRYGYCRARPELRVVRVDQPRTDLPADSVWCYPGDVARLEFDVDERCLDATACARAGTESWPFSPATTSTLLTLEVTPELRKAWDEAKVLSLLFACCHRRESCLTSLRAIPGRLSLKDGSCSFSLHQRQSTEVPGSRGYLRVELDDVTGGQVMTSLSAGESERPVAAASLREWDSLPIDLPEARYVLGVERLCNLLMGEDFAVLSLSTPEAWETSRIVRLLECLEASDLTFLREGQEYTGKDAAAHLRDKMQSMQSGPPSIERFIEEVGSRSSTTGSPYQVRLPDGGIVDSATWLRRKADELFGAATPTPQGDGPAEGEKR
ncbi:MAG: DUF5329 family protein [Planctomycetes bacterium]|nr:DUF5329 family protein [Planctomycetota bacterium]